MQVTSLVLYRKTNQLFNALTAHQKNVQVAPKGKKIRRYSDDVDTWHLNYEDWKILRFKNLDSGDLNTEHSKTEFI